MNKYRSALRTMTARNILAGSIDPQNTLIIQQGVYRQNFYGFELENFNASNFIIKSIGLFCNYAHGLVLRYPDPRLNLKAYGVNIFSMAALTGTVSQADDIITGVGTLFLTELSVGNLIQINSAGRPMFVRQIYGDLSIQVSDFMTVAAGAAMSKIPLGVTTAGVHVDDIGLLNYAYAVERFIPVATITPANNHILYAEIEVPGDVQFLTTTVNCGFAGQMALFDMVAEVEITAA